MLNTVTMADDYFRTNYFGADKWSAIEYNTKELLVATAEADVATALRCELDPSWAIAPTSPYTPVQMAIFEWALYLHDNKNQISRRMAGKGFGLESVEVEGIGKETYGSGSSARMGWYYSMMMTSRAGQFLNMIQRDVRVVR